MDTFNINSVLNDNGMVSVFAKGFDLDSIKKIILYNKEAIQKHPFSFSVILPENAGIPQEVSSALKILGSRGMVRVIEGPDLEYIFHSISNLSVKKIHLVVSASQNRNEIIPAAKNNHMFVVFCQASPEGEIQLQSGRKPQHENGDFNAGRNHPQSSVDRHNKRPQRYDNRRKTLFQITTKPENITSVEHYRSVDEDIDAVIDESWKSYRLTEKQIINNNASTFSTDVDGLWVKLYNKNMLNSITRDKITKMLEHKLDKEGVCWPVGIAKDTEGNFRGYFFKAFKGMPLQLSVLKVSGLKKSFPSWNKKDLCILTLTILDKIKFLHDNGILMGCINPASIRVVDPKTVYFIDTDNYQVEGFPSFVYNLSFRPPELIDKNIYLATLDSENFAVAELVFMLMMTGKTPYVAGVSKNPKADIKRMHFPYPLRFTKGRDALPSMWRFMWSHLSLLKKPFYDTFQKDGYYNHPGTRMDVRYWIKKIQAYLEQLEQPEDNESLKIYPKTFLKKKGDVFYKCAFCGTEHPRFYFSDRYFDEFRICNDCLKKKSNVSFTCLICNQEFFYSNETALFHYQMQRKDDTWMKQRYCRDHKEKANSVYKYIRCRTCGKTFHFLYKDHIFYKNRRFSEPVNCPDCRKRR